MPDRELKKIIFRTLSNLREMDELDIKGGFGYKNYEKSLAIIKDFINRERAKEKGYSVIGIIELSNDYNKLRKLPKIQTNEKIKALSKNTTEGKTVEG